MPRIAAAVLVALAGLVLPVQTAAADVAGVLQVRARVVERCAIRLPGDLPSGIRRHRLERVIERVSARLQRRCEHRDPPRRPPRRPGHPIFGAVADGGGSRPQSVTVQRRADGRVVVITVRY